MISRITEEAKPEIIGAYVDDLTPMKEIASWVGVSKNAIYQFLKRAGVNTSKSVRVKMVCDTCKEEYELRRGEARRQRTQRHHFCGSGCYYIYLESRDTIMNRYGSRTARRKVAEIFDLQPEHRVHHLDKDQTNNLLSNLVVFKDQGDHVRYHRDFEIELVWDGRNQ